MTIQSYEQDSSAYTRVMVWQWALDFARDHPFGGGFRAYEVNVIYMPPDAFFPDGWVQRARAPHSTWIEMLNELGIPGLAIFLGLITSTLLSLRRINRLTRDIEELRWCHDLARALAMALLVLMSGATFVGIGFQPWFWLIFASSYSLREYVRRVVAPAPSPFRLGQMSGSATGGLVEAGRTRA